MTPEICVLITLLGGEDLIRLAMKFSDRNALADDLIDYPRECRAEWESLLPEHLKGLKVLKVEQIDDVVFK